MAVLNGGENAEEGQILRIDLSDGRQEILATGLDKPTGLAVVDEVVWVATRDAILRFPLAEPAAIETILSDLPNNGRSNGTLTVTGDNQLLYETSGNRRDEASGKMWQAQSINP